MTIRALLGELCDTLATAEPDNPRGEALWIVGTVWDCDPHALLLGQGGDVADHGRAQRCRAMVQRRLAGEPLQYILGRWEFMGLPFLVGEGVLIPRPETELTAQLALGHIKKTPQPFALDLCSGSGCIAIALGFLCPAACVWGVELSPVAYDYFGRNIALNRVQNVTAIQGDALQPAQPVTDRRYHVVTSNPPYIATNELGTLQCEVQHEPMMALDGGGDGLDFYRRLPAIAYSLLLPNGLLVLEIGDEQGDAVCKLVSDAGFVNVTLHRDLSGHDRVVTALRAQ